MNLGTTFNSWCSATERVPYRSVAAGLLVIEAAYVSLVAESQLLVVAVASVVLVADS